MSPKTGNNGGRSSKVAMVLGCLAALGSIAGCGQTNWAEHNFEKTTDIAALIDWECTNDTKEYSQRQLREDGFAHTPCTEGAINLWVSDAKRDEFRASPLDAGQCRIDGGNWTVSGTQYKVEDAHKKLGGELACA